MEKEEQLLLKKISFLEKELALKTRELEIEVSLERAHEKTMAMQKPSEFVDVINMIGEQFIHLGFDVDWVNFSANGHDVSKAIDIWNFFFVPGVYQGATRLVIPFFEHPVFTKAVESVNEYYTSGNGFSVVELNKKDKDSFLDHLFTNTIYKDLPDEVKISQYSREAYLTFNVVLKDTWLSIGKYDTKLLTDEQIAILKRLANTFGQAYTRFLDLQNVQAEARESQIQLALQRVRARTMAMQKSDELQDATLVLFQQFQQLQQSPNQVSICIFDDEIKIGEMYVTLNGEKIDRSFKMELNDEVFMMKKARKAFIEKQENFSAAITGKELQEYNQWRNYFVGAKRWDESNVALRESWYVQAAFFSKGMIGVSSDSPVPDETVKLLEQFAKVFDGTYTRFNDLQKAEAQARAAQIEAALERVRSNTMAMRKSSDLLDVIKTLGDQFQLLGFKIHSANFNTSYRQKDWNLWLYNPGNPVYPEQVHIPYLDNPFFNRTLESIASGSDFHSVVFTKEEKDSFLDHLYANTIARNSSEERKKFTYDAPGFAWSTVYLKNTALTIANYDAEPYTEEQNAIIGRFGNAFEQTYTRFLDLQKAEAQAREAQIQLALERVRAKSLAIHHSSELQEVVNIVAQQLHNMDIDMNGGVFICINKEVDKDTPLWAAAGAADYVQKVVVPNASIPIISRLRDAIKEGNNFWEEEFSNKEKKEFFRKLFRHEPWRSLPEERKKELLSREGGYTRSVTVMQYTSIAMVNHNGKRFSAEENEILKRFGNVFEQSYTRFLDLQKSEAQAREALIEAGLERVRSRAMAMQNSEELAALIGTVFTELTKLDIALTRCVIWIFNAETNGAVWWMANSEDPQNPINCDVPFNGNEPHRFFLEQWKKRAIMFQYELCGTIKKDWDDYLFSKTGLSRLPAVVIEGMKAPERVILTASFNNFGAVNAASLQPLSYEHEDILLRFAKVFDLTYTRFNDLKQAEAQAREAQIEAALERVRSRSLAMHRSDELKEAGELLWNELDKLGIPSLSSGYVLMDRKEKIGWFYAPNPATGKIADPLGADHTKTKEMRAVLSAWEKQEPLSIIEMNEQETIEHQTFIAENGIQTDGTISHWITAEELIALSPKRLFLHNFNFKEGYLMIVGGSRLTDKQVELMLRFTRVFQQTYTRFNDLQKAEAQAREGQIQLALERVRARTMAMQKSDELSETAYILFQQFKDLGEDPIQITIGVFMEDEKVVQFRITGFDGSGSKMDQAYNMDIDEPILMKRIYTRWKEQKKSMVIELAGKDLNDWIGYRSKIAELNEPAMFSAGDKRFVGVGFFSKGMISFSKPDPIAEETIKILERFAAVFDQTYTRFLDLQKAEAQAGEARIEAALERIRSRTMGMQKSEELKEIIQVVYEQLIHLNILVEHAGFIMDYKTRDDMHIWLADKHEVPSEITIPYFDSSHWNSFIEAKENGINFFVNHLNFEEKNKFYQNLFKLFPVAEEAKEYYFNCPGLAVSTVLLDNVGLYIENFSGTPYSDEENKTLMRFGKVFEQTYTRFLDLQKAEAQTREAKIEASLERVRGKAMAMHSSRDLADTIDVFYHEMELLSVTPRRCGVGLMDKETHAVELSTMNTTEQGESVEVIGKLKLTGHPVLEGIYDNWILQKEYRPVLLGNEIKKYYQLIRPQIAYPDYPTDTAQYGYFFFFNEGGVYAWTEKELSEDELKIYRRFTSVLSLTYKRYKDLKDAEANGREAIKRASLDRVRAETASMRTTGDLEKITPLIWNELTTLNVPFIRCGVFIMDEEQELIHSFLSTPQGKAIAAFQLPYDSAGELSKVLTNWHKNEIFRDHWNEAAFAEWTKSLVERGAIASEGTYSTAHRPVNLHLHFLPFLQGMLYVGSEAPLNDEEINLAQTLADAFSTAYARYEDFNQLESAKAQIEKTLVDLKQAQAQLVQSEKMASLGELTAGIAHEIQNPLNFVNNFSDVNAELIDELNAERLKPAEERDEQLETEILNDIKENEQKINHHGKRADAIVKGMLQHSRKTAGQKEPADINALADEYLRLSYHGLRAKDKTFNAELKTDFDGRIGKINIIPQDIGRVLLNLFNNAFYAVNEQKTQNPESYKPTVSVTTMKCDDKVQIIVSDNGNGIPQNIVDKIFQPFFTTKPTGEGTGLGLSLAYDIIKVHGGTLKVASKEGEGSEFIIQLPTS